MKPRQHQRLDADFDADSDRPASSKYGGNRGKKGRAGRPGGRQSPAKKKKVRGAKLRIIGGDMGGRYIAYHGEAFTRPMRDTIRENLFNIMGPAIAGTHAVDLFAGTGVLGFEALSRGSTSATMIEQNRMAAIAIESNAKSLSLDPDRYDVIVGDTFRLGRKVIESFADGTPLVAFLCPPYAMWDTATNKLNDLIEAFIETAPEGSRLVAETEKWFDTATWPGDDWDIRVYGNTVLGFL